MAFRWRPRPPPRPPKGKNVIPFPSDRVTPPGGTRLGDIVPDPPINLKEIRKAKELELRNAIQSEGMSPFPEGKGLSELGEEIPVKDLPKENISSPEDQQLFILNRERMTPEQRAMRERDDEVILNDLATLDRKLLNKREKELRSNLDKLMGEDPRSDKKNSQGLPLTKTQIAVAKHFLDMIVAEIKRREERGLSGLEGERPLIKKVGKGLDEASKAMKKITNDPVFEAVSNARKELDKISKSKKGLSGVGEKIRSLRKKKMSSTEKYMLESILKDVPEVPSEKGIRSLVDEKRLQRKLDKVGLGLPLEEGATNKQKYDQALEQQKPKNLSHLDHSMITDYEFRINKLIKDMNVNKPIEELVYDLGTMLDYVDWDTDYKRSERYEGPDKRRRDRYYPPHYPAVLDQNRKVSGDDAKLQEGINNLVYKIKAEIEKRMRDE